MAIVQQREDMALDKRRGSANEEYLDEPRVTNEYVLNVAFFSFVGFMLVQAFFSIWARSQAMLADSEAMAVDALTYLFNLVAERMKHRPYTEKEMLLPHHIRHYRRKKLRLQMELIPPLISVTTLLVVTVYAIRDAVDTLLSEDDVIAEEEPMVNMMLLFSGANLILDIVNVMCFARAHQAIVLEVSEDEHHYHHLQMHRIGMEHDNHGHKHAANQGETEGLTAAASQSSSYQSIGGQKQENGTNATYQDDESDDESGGGVLSNLNMCSAWTHVCADTLRSVTVLIAAGIALMFDAVSPTVADSVGTIVVCVVILISLGPLFSGLYMTWVELRDISSDNPERV